MDFKINTFKKGRTIKVRIKYCAFCSKLSVGNMIYWQTKDEVCGNKPIYCPMCGRRLKQGDKNESYISGY